jgi:hypothetical protein
MVIHAAPAYAFQLSDRMKNFSTACNLLTSAQDFCMTCTAIVIQGMSKGGEILKYLNFTGENLGFRIAPDISQFRRMPLFTRSCSGSHTSPGCVIQVTLACINQFQNKIIIVFIDQFSTNSNSCPLGIL